ncbi:Putative alpha/beta hydrolase-1 [Septoria linicola]|uniref:Alpha/beta hydrolase-1 n=1 Tax=Septoria linicola TaxID=215465 RepID=A0A9Q9AIQ7_9PEZI|nr:putative alpha/beta hydrolase-1 [Septoria linicola]USW47185.1 Putative alpha/beta hydrolase-1 [Septoria linicola]
MEGPGYLAVAIQPGKDTDETAFHDWYNTEHGPLRLRLPFIETGDRYKAADSQQPEWSAVYDVSDLTWVNKRIYSRLREERSKREKNVMSTFESLDRKIYSLVSVRGDSKGPGPHTLAGSLRVNESDWDDLSKWYEEEHIDMMSKVPGWIRTRRFKMVVGGINGMPPSGQVEHLAVHDFKELPDLTSAAFKEINSTPWRNRIVEKATWRQARLWSHHLTFDALEEPPSSVITTDGAELRFQLEGNPADPVIVCVNSIMTNLHIWDDVAKALMTGVTGKTYRVLRYNSRGYSQQAEKSNDTTFDLLADDLEYLLQRLNIEKVHAVVGVSMGGVTSINFAIRHPDMLEKYVACDCNVASSPANSQAWADRVELAKTKGMSELAKVTVSRWFTPENGDSENAKKVLPMATNANLEGFRLNSLALSEYDLKPRLQEIKVPGLLIAGEGDGKIPEAMQKFGIPNTTFKQIPKAGHLPFLENHDAFVEALAGFL